MKATMDIYEEKRPWGRFRRFTENENSTVKIITIKPNEELSLQSHKNRSEFWRVISGSGVSDIDGKIENIIIGDEKFVPIGIKHRLKALDSGIEILEIALGHFDEEDITRFEDKYGRI